jgi:hypothetical protein
MQIENTTGELLEEKGNDDKFVVPKTVWVYAD